SPARRVAQLRLGLHRLVARHARGARDPHRRADGAAKRPVRPDGGAQRMSVGAKRGRLRTSRPAVAGGRPTGLLRRLRPPRNTFLRSLMITAGAGLGVFVLSEVLSPFDNLRLASVGYYFAALAGLTVLTGLNGQISLGHGAFMAVGAY